MGEADRRKVHALKSGRPVVEATMRIVRYGERFGLKRVQFYLDSFTSREAYDAVCAIKQTFETNMGFVETPMLPPASQTRTAPPRDGGVGAEEGEAP